MTEETSEPGLSWVLPEPTPRMNPAVKKLWVDALRSGRYPQGCGRLMHNGHYCCLGVLCEISELGSWQEHPEKRTDKMWYVTASNEVSMVLPVEVAAWAGLVDPHPCILREGKTKLSSLAGLNDGGMSFNDQAELIDKHL